MLLSDPFDKQIHQRTETVFRNGGPINSLGSTEDYLNFMKSFVALLLAVLLLVQVVAHEEPQHDLLGIGNSYRYVRGYSSPWGRWGKGVWGKSRFGNPIYGGAAGGYRTPGFGGSRIWKHQAEE